MNIILLSGGSGKRLWPLSNDIRSKQFIKMFKNAEGELESMIQRVYSQIKSVDKDAKITIATGRKQVSIINNQLRGGVSICDEPLRRDTFPAIALATAYLKDVSGVGEDESVLVCPVDPYVGNEYFEALKELFELSKTNKYNLNLMGVEPTYPSEKFGYIMPCDKEHISKVKEFKEKPDTTTAKKYIESGALWNCGVFAFKVGYLMDIARKHFGMDKYEDIYNNYANLEKISFDYAVVEKEDNIGSLRFGGEWKEIGLWSTFAEEMDEPVIGKAMLNETCENTNVINELNIPLLCMGCKDMVIAASGDGILVTSKADGDSIKPFVDQFDNQAMYAEKSWGSFNVLEVQEDSIVIKIVLLPGHKLYYHSHAHRDEVWTVVSGEGITIVDGEKREVSIGDVITMKRGQKHTLIAKTEINVIEVQTGKNITVEDKTKYELDVEY